ncbi:MAG: AmmeMemoRadiSam system protein B [Nannocystaceae bacterium]
MERPKLRRIHRSSLRRGEEALVVLRDPLLLCEPVAVDAQFGSLLDLMDGRRTVEQIRQTLMFQGVAVVSIVELRAFVQDLSADGWLEDERFRRRWEEIHTSFLKQAVREPYHAGVIYSETPEDLRRSLPPPKLCASGPGGDVVVGVVCPYQPFEISRNVLRPLFAQLPLPTQVDCVVVIATDHFPGLMPYALTAKPYRTPLGTVRVDAGCCADLIRRVPWLTREETRHRTALTTEMAALLLRHVYGGEGPPVVSLLCGQNVLAGSDESDEVEEMMAAIEAVFGGLRVLWWAMAELSHVGPAYGDELGVADLDDVRRLDRTYLDAFLPAVSPGRAATCLGGSTQLGGPPTGAPSLVTLAKVVPVGTLGHLAAYELVPVPGPTPGWAGLCGVHLTKQRRIRAGPGAEPLFV